MKDLVNPCLRGLFLLVFSFVGFTSVNAQSNPDVKKQTILTNTVFVDTIESMANGQLPLLVFEPGKTYQVQSRQVSSGKYELEFTFEPNFVGNEILTINYWVQNFPLPFGLPEFMQYHFNIVPSIVKAEDDIVVKTSDTLSINPLTNDNSSTDSHQLISINQVKHGAASISGDTIEYIGTSDTDIILYTIKDSMGVSDQGVIYLVKEDPTFSGVDTVKYSIINTATQMVVLPNANFSLNVNPGNGNVTSIAGLAYEYTPDPGFDGSDFFTFEDGNGNSLTYAITVLNTLLDKGYIKDDVFYTAKNTPIIFDVSVNDLVKSGFYTNYSAALNQVGPNSFEYIPPANYVGTRKFTYTKSFGTRTETGSISINVGNMPPDRSIVYQFDVVSGEEFYFDYDVPISGYELHLAGLPSHGVAQTFTTLDAFEGACDTVANAVGLMYRPNSNYTGTDELDIEYCIGQDCDFYKLRFNIVADQDSICGCVDDCVFAGDANGDGRISVTDLLSIGRYMGDAGSTRIASTQAINVGEFSEDWYTNQINGKNAKHIDANRDGVITEDDVASISTNYGQVNELVPYEFLNTKDYPVYLIPNETVLDSGDVLILTVSIGNANYPVKDITGITYGFNLNPNLFDSASAQITLFDDGWFASQSPTIGLDLHQSAGDIDVGFTRTNGKGITGYGPIGQLSIIVEEDITGIKTDKLINEIVEHVYLQDVIMEDTYGTKYKLSDAVASFKVNIGKDDENVSSLQVYPNPVDNILNVHINGNGELNSYQMFSMEGKIVLNSEVFEVRNTTIDVSNLASGIYILQVMTNEGPLTSKVYIH